MMRGRRLPDGSPIAGVELPGDYLRCGEILWCILPDGTTARIDNRWKIEEHEDGTLSLGPHNPGESHSIRRAGGWHGFLRHGVWERA